MRVVVETVARVEGDDDEIEDEDVDTSRKLEDNDDDYDMRTTTSPMAVQDAPRRSSRWRSDTNNNNNDDTRIQRLGMTMN